MKTKHLLLKLFLMLIFSVFALGTWAQNQDPTQTVCLGSQPYYVDVSPITGATYNWSLPVGGTITSGAGTESIIVDWTVTGGPYTLSVYTSADGCDGPVQSVDVNVVAEPIGPTLDAKSPDLASVCDGTNVSATFTAGSGGVGCSDAYEYRFDGGAWTAYTQGADLNTTGHTLVEIQGQRSGCTADAGCTGTSWLTLASWTVAPTPLATISYSGSPYCTSVETSQNVTRTGTKGGTYSSTAGLTLNTSTGAILPSTSTAGDYVVSYTIAASGGCDEVTTTTPVTITTAPLATIIYTGSPFCFSLATPQAVTQTGTTGGTYTALPAGLSINASTGEITPSESAIDDYTVTYTIPASGGCAEVTTTTPVTITTAPSPTIFYDGSPFCFSLASPQSVTHLGITGGTYSSAPGLTIDPSTGDIVPNTSTVGDYIVTYTIAASGGCAAVNTTTPVSITNAPNATIAYAGTPFCTSKALPQDVTRTGTTGGTYSSTAGLIINSSTGAITPSTSTAGDYVVTYTIAASGGCAEVTTTTTVTITTVPEATIAYDESPFCNDVVTDQLVTQTGTSGGIYTALPAGLTINASSGAITPGTSTEGDYTVTYTIDAAGGCVAVIETALVTINPIPVTSPIWHN
ncbi:MAG: hypothetical protein PF436_07230 [Prolixibacteraceae bacterium]|jgi:hypothetical protein|nr:hypothetical protein [Prolixibacteraceae bacterium]